MYRPISSNATAAMRRTRLLRPVQSCRAFHNYFVTHLPSSSMHPDSRSPAGPSHNLPRAASTPYTPGSKPDAVPARPPNMPSRDLTVVRIPLRRAKHHFGVSVSRGQRPGQEDANQAGTIRIPAFAKRVPVFYFAVFDGHGGSECADFLRDELHGYIEEAAAQFGLRSSLKKDEQQAINDQPDRETQPSPGPLDAARLESELLEEYKSTIGGYFRRWRPNYLSVTQPTESDEPQPSSTPVTLESVLTYAFLRADLDFVTAQARKPDPDDPFVSDNPLNRDEILGAPHLPPSGHHTIGGPGRFKGGSTASIALISTPTPAPFWHPAAHSTLVVAHVGDTRVLLCETASGRPIALTANHRPSHPTESRRLRRWVTNSLVTDSFGEERFEGLANSRSFGDMLSKRVGVSSEPDIARIDMLPAQFSFLVLLSDGVSGTLSDQEVVDVIKEAATPEEGARKVVEYATEVSHDGDNATCMVVRLGGWERRSEGGVGSLGTKEMRDLRRMEAQDPRRRGRL
ncbi:hypothetical protein VTJ49DRAFT_6780 [Mycothermus thermophilus]|uniref:PPM-type phosphatase domain-containing protein n=1 Tax=Humicola insolens TaxID=85995 RepID=A0ABR3V1R8_HUMIN